MPAEADRYSLAHVRPCLANLTLSMGGSTVITYPWLVACAVSNSRRHVRELVPGVHTQRMRAA